MPQPKRPVPHDFADHAPGASIKSLVKRYRAAERVIRRWMDEAGIAVTFGSGRASATLRPLPDDWAEQARVKTKLRLIEHYQSSYQCIYRWFKESGLTPIDGYRARRAPTPNLGRMGRTNRVSLAPNRLKSLYDEAADDLRRERFPVNRCDEKGLFDPKGDYWRVGWSVLTPDDLLLRAAKYRIAA